MQDQIFPAGPPSTALVSTSESTSSTTYTDLTTTTDTVTVTIGSSGMCEVWLSGLLTTTYDGGGAYMSFTMSGANTQAASDAESIYCEVYVPGSAGAIGVSSVGIPLMLYNLTPGVTTFKAKYEAAHTPQPSPTDASQPYPSRSVITDDRDGRAGTAEGARS